jgi:hypothetical protein
MPPPASLLSLLFHFKYVEGIRDYRVLAEKFGVIPEAVRWLDGQLTVLLKSKIGKITPDRLETVCPECLDTRVYEDPETGERVCGSCGAVLDHVSFDDEPPIRHYIRLDKRVGLRQEPGRNVERQGFDEGSRPEPVNRAASQILRKR